MQKLSYFAAVALLLLESTGVSKATSFTLYATDGSQNGGGTGNSHLLIIDPTTGGVLQTIGLIGAPIVSLAYDSVSMMLYGVTGGACSGKACPGPISVPDQLVVIDPATAAMTIVGSILTPGGSDTIKDLAFDSAGHLFGWGNRSSGSLLFSISTTPSSNPLGTPLGAPFALNEPRGAGLAFDSSGVLYLAGDTLTGLDANFLYSVNTSTGLATSGPVLKMPSTLVGGGPNRIGSLDFDSNGVLYGAFLLNTNTDPDHKNSYLITLETTGPNAGTVMQVGPMSNNVSAIAFLPDASGPGSGTPEPTTLVFFGVGLVSMFAGKKFAGKKLFTSRVIH